MGVNNQSFEQSAVPSIETLFSMAHAKEKGECCIYRIGCGDILEKSGSEKEFEVTASKQLQKNTQCSVANTANAIPGGINRR